MTFRIHFTWPDGTDDSITITGETVDEIRIRTMGALADRNLDAEKANAWSEEL